MMFLILPNELILKIFDHIQLPATKLKFAIICHYIYETLPKHLFIFMNSILPSNKLILGHKHFYITHGDNYVYACKRHNHIAIYDAHVIKWSTWKTLCGDNIIFCMRLYRISKHYLHFRGYVKMCKEISSTYANISKHEFFRVTGYVVSRLHVKNIQCDFDAI